MVVIVEFIEWLLWRIGRNNVHARTGPRLSRAAVRRGKRGG